MNLRNSSLEIWASLMTNVTQKDRWVLILKAILKNWFDWNFKNLTEFPFEILEFKGGTGDFEVSWHVSKQITISQKLYTKGG